MSTADFIIIPEFVQKTLQRNSVSLSTVLDFRTLQQYLSTNDIVDFVTAQEYWAEVISHYKFSYQVSLPTVWRSKYLSDADKALLDQVCFLQGAQGQTKDKVLHRIYDQASNDQAGNDSFEVVDLAPDVYGLVIHSGYKPVIETKRAVIRSIVKALNVYSPFCDVATTPFFDVYLLTLTN